MKTDIKSHGELINPDRFNDQFIEVNLFKDEELRVFYINAMKKEKFEEYKKNNNHQIGEDFSWNLTFEELPKYNSIVASD